MSFCKYKNIFGIPGEGIHKYRIFGFAIVDIVITIFAALVISKMFPSIGGFIPMLIILVLLGIVVHKIFCVDTALNNMIF